MDNGCNRLDASTQDGAGRGQQLSLIYAVMVCVAMLILLQTLMLNIAVEGYLGGMGKVIYPATISSGLCYVGSCWLIRYVRRLADLAQ